MRKPAMKPTTLITDEQLAREVARARPSAVRVLPSMCDVETGVCELPGAGEPRPEPRANHAGGEVLYVGDPMCSACWGISPALRKLEAEASERGIPFRILVGGLRAGGGDAWTPEFRSFLREHWEEIGARTGQPFCTRFMDRASLDYDPEPSCRAFVVLRDMLSERDHAPASEAGLFGAIQRKFYVDAEDPTVASFYESIAAEYDLDFATFVERFEHPDAKTKAAREFQEVRALGVRAFPTVLYRDGASASVLAIGSRVTAADMVTALDNRSRS